MSLKESMTKWQRRINNALENRLPKDSIQPTTLHEAMRSSVLLGGKRIRPVLVYAVGQCLGADENILDNPACAVEIIHAYSLIHDDLPAMDDDDLRRGQPTCHIRYGEAMAILAGDALQPLAFQILTRSKQFIPTENVLKMTEILAAASGSHGMAGGQAIDLESVGKKLNIAELENMHIHKTGALIRASVQLGALCQPDVTAGQLEALDHYGKCVGLAFQVHDDILDIEAPTETLGKPQGADAALNKPTYPAILGLKESKELALELHEDATAHLNILGDKAQILRELSAYIVGREY
ncbi:(2E,6E)-farnesyl diphosphate synthase [hydrothermal vent metagenome]|uniref:(2E,6E)-farnesyl diphosphate synthase n=1 Tax=hydrothermal vent metagenome TaxID=652676 RepID=A0A3B1AHB4_9ZZZZ